MQRPKHNIFLMLGEMYVTRVAMVVSIDKPSVVEWREFPNL